MTVYKHKFSPLLAILCFMPISLQASAPWLETMISNKVPHAQVAVVVEDLSSHKRLIERRADEHYIPASVTKLFTATAALLELGPGYQIHTRLYFDSKKIKNHKLNAPVWLVMHGDPVLRTEDLNELFKVLKNKYGITSVQQIYIDDGYFSEDYWPFGITWNSLAWGYLAPVGSIVLNKNSVAAQIIVNSSDKSAHIKSLSPYLTIHDKGISAVSNDYAENYCHLSLIIQPNNHLSAGGCWSEQSKDIKLAVTDPKKLLTDTLPSVFKAAGISINHKIAFKNFTNTKKDYTEIAHASPPLSELLQPMLFESDNVVANALTKTLAVKHEQAGTLQAGAQVILTILQEKLGHDWHQELVLKDGAGGSYNNLITANSVAILLKDIAERPELSQWILPVLPKPTSKDIYKVPANLAELFVAKTGTMHNNMNLAGYIMQNNLPTHSFVIFVNNAGADEAPSRELQGEILQDIYRKLPTNALLSPS